MDAASPWCREWTTRADEQGGARGNVNLFTQRFTRVVFPDRARFNFGFSKFIVHFATCGVWYRIPAGGVHEANKFRVNFRRNRPNYFSKTQIIFSIVLITS